jgi:hypothetical protein
MLAFRPLNLAFNTKIIGSHPTTMYCFRVERIMKNQTHSTISIRKIVVCLEKVISMIIGSHS